MYARWTLLVLLGLTLVAGALRFWHVNEPGRVTSDEYYFVNDARHYLDRTFYFDAHPPFGKLVIAAGMRLSGDQPWGWRWIGAALGTLLIPLLFLLGRQLTNSDRVGLGAAFLGAIDGLLLVDARLALLNTTLVFLAVAAIWLALRSPKLKGWMAAGAIFGLAFATKWVALGLLIPLGVIWWRQGRHWRYLSAGLGVAALAYLLVFGLHFILVGGKPDLLTTHRLMLRHHTSITTHHAYESPWWNWPLQIRPFVYTNDPGAAGQRRVIADLGNPLLWWLSLIAAVATVIRRWRDPAVRLTLIALVSLWLPFVLIRRPMFSYHLLLAAPFFWLLALIGWNAWMTTTRRRRISLAVGAVLLAVSLWFWPVWTWRPLTDEQLNTRQWLPTWFVPRLDAEQPIRPR